MALGLIGTNNPASPPYKNGPYTWDADITFSGTITFTGSFTFGDAVTDTLTVNGTITQGAFGDASGIALTDSNLKAHEIYPELAAAGDALTGGNVAYGIRNRFLVNKAQTNNVSLYATQGQMRVKANLAAGVHAGLYGYFEQSGTVTLSSSGSFNTACNLAVEGSSGLTVDSGVNLAICVMTNVLDNSATVNGNYYGLLIRESSGKKTMKAGIIVNAAATSAPILVDGSSAALLASGEQAIYVNCPSETVATNGMWVTLKSTVTSGDLSGLRSQVTSNSASSGANPRGVYSQALVGASKFAATAEGILSTVDVSAGSCTITDATCVVGHFSTGASATITNLAVGKFRAQTRGDETVSGIDTLLMLQNEAVGGNGRQMDSWINCTTTSLSGGIKAAGFLIDGGTSTDLLGTAFARLPDDQTIVSDDNQSILVDISGTTNDGFIKVVVGSADKYIALYDLKSS